MRLSRKYDRMIEIYRSNQVDDTFGGTTLEAVLVKKVWARYETLENTKVTELGLDINKTVLEVLVQYDSSIDWEDPTLYFKIGDKEYGITQVSNLHLRNIEIKIIATDG